MPSVASSSPALTAVRVCMPVAPSRRDPGCAVTKATANARLEALTVRERPPQGRSGRRRRGQTRLPARCPAPSPPPCVGADWAVPAATWRTRNQRRGCLVGGLAGAAAPVPELASTHVTRGLASEHTADSEPAPGPESSESRPAWPCRHPFDGPAGRASGGLAATVRRSTRSRCPAPGPTPCAPCCRTGAGASRAVPAPHTCPSNGFVQRLAGSTPANLDSG